MDNWNIADVISIIAIVVSVISLLFSWYTNKRFSEERYLKEIMIDDIKHLREDYRLFLNKLMSDQCSARFIISWFKVMNLKMDGIADFINSEYHDEIFESCQNNHNELKRFVTGCADMNDNFNQEAIIFTDTVKNSMIEIHMRLYRSLLIAISYLNKK